MKRLWTTIAITLTLLYGSLSLVFSENQTATFQTTLNANAPFPPHLSKKSLHDELLPQEAPIAIIFCHGLGGSSDQGSFYKKACLLPAEKFCSIDFPCSTKLTTFPHLKTCFAQEAEQQVIVNKYLELVKEGYKVLLLGVSNGASTIITTAGCYELKNCIGIIAESPYDNPYIIITRILGSAATLLMSLQSLVSGYNPTGIRPIEALARIDKHIPLLFICSKQDTLVTADQTESLHTKAVSLGLNSHLIKLDNGEHANLLWGRDGDIYFNSLHEWAKKYFLPYHTIENVCNKIVTGMSLP